MKHNECHAFQEWLERLPRTELSPAFRRHLEQCPDCARSYGELGPLVEKLSEFDRFEPLSAAFISTIASRTVASHCREQARRTVTRLVLVSLLSLPFLVLINGFWAYCGYFLFETYVSPLSAQIYLVLFLVISTLASSIAYGLIPLMAGWLNARVPEESIS